MVCQEKEDHVEMNICNTGSEAALYKAGGLEWNQILTLKEKALASQTQLSTADLLLSTNLTLPAQEITICCLNALRS